MAKKAKTFRLSEQALENLSKVVSLTGSSEVAVIEFALAFVVKLFERKDEETDKKTDEQTDEQTKETGHTVPKQTPQTQPSQRSGRSLVNGVGSSAQAGQ